MRIDLQQPDTWAGVNQTYREALALPGAGYSVQSYMGLRHAIWEICLGLTQLFPTKKTIVYSHHSRSVFENMAVALSREGFTIKLLTDAEMNSPAFALDPHLKDLLFLFWSVDDPVTGELFQYPALQESLKDKRIHRIEVSHSKHTCIAPQVPLPFDAKILSIRGDRAISVSGERFKMQPPIASGLNWPSLSLEQAQSDLARHDEALYETMKSRVLTFEDNLPSGAERVLAQDKQRLFDRALFAFRDLDGLAFIIELAQHLGLDVREPGVASRIETTSLCRWKDERIFKDLGREDLQREGLAPELIRGLVLLSAETLVGDIKGQVEKTRKKLLALQNSL